jgi:hypothetical protein
MENQMTWHKFELTGTSLLDGKQYSFECGCCGMSKYEKESWIRENNLDPKTCKITKTKSK